MCLRLARWFCLALGLLSSVGAQRTGWGSPMRGYSGSSGFWASNAAGNSFPANQNSGFGSWGSSAGGNKQPAFEEVYPNPDYGSFGGNANGNRPASGSNNRKPGSWGSASNGNPDDEFFGAGKNSRKPNRQSESFGPKKENEKKLASITNWSSSSNKIPSTDEKENSVFSSWGSGKSPKPTSGTSSGQNSRPGWNSDNDESNTWNSNPASGQGNNQNSRPGAGNNWNSRPTSAVGNGQNSRPASGSDGDLESSSSNWNSVSSGGRKPNGNDVLSNFDYEDNSSWNGNTNRRPSSNSNSGSAKNNQRGNKKKPSSSETNNSNPGNGKPPSSSNTQTQGKPSTVDTSILDELDKNDWYFGKESDYPKPPFKSTLNIDVSELWNFDKNRRPSKNSGGNNKTSSSNNNTNNKRRRNRQIGNFQGGQEINCECVEVDLCSEEDMIVTQEDIKADWRPLEAFQCQELTQVCCTDPKYNPVGRTNVVREETDNNLRCGQRRIGESIFSGLGGSVAEPGEFPWSLNLENTEINCSASLIHPALALTAAHCVASAQPYELTATGGVWKLNSEPSQRRRVVKIIPHPGYSSQNPRNDIALLVLENPFKLTDNVNTVCLPVTNDKWDPSECLVAGWSQEEINGEELAVLEKGVVNFLPQDECQSIMLVTDLWRNYVLHESFVCGIEKNKRESCLGDEGGPLVCPSKKQPGTYLQIGIVSKGMNCDDFGRPGIFTNVLQFLDWINQNAFELGLFDDIDVRSL